MREPVAASNTLIDIMKASAIALGLFIIIKIFLKGLGVGI